MGRATSTERCRASQGIKDELSSSHLIQRLINNRPFELEEDDTEIVDLPNPNLKDIFANLENNSSKPIREDALSPYRVVQAHLILGEYEALVEKLSEWSEEIASDYLKKLGSSRQPESFLRFAAHLVILLQNHGYYPTTGSIERQEKVATILRSFIDYLEATKQGDLVAFYTSFLPPLQVDTNSGRVPLSVYVYSHFLVPIQKREDRLKYLKLAYDRQLDVPLITLEVVDEIMAMADDELPDDIKRVTTMDNYRIEALEWLLFNEEQHLVALSETNSVVHAFLRTFTELLFSRMSQSQTNLKPPSKLSNLWRHNYQRTSLIANSLVMNII